MSFCSTIPTDAGRYQSLPLSSVTLGDVVLNGVDGSAAVFVPQVDGFGDDGVRVLLRDLRGEKPLEGRGLVFSINTTAVITADLPTLQRNFAMPSGRLMPINTIL